ncbi:hypothetical protein [Actinokineospora terrae]|uniref:Uncharacterized protein n=1 Tax=Actinokineospora terrae TaxID=155974 RepID=A0A1H9XNY4_9PSEU|nr:hypothetical protein [Actinokineospora terrae]SES47872.1 hypothetical protein SAMN04487818_11823 [Actinokineospora terrae]
MSQTPDQRDEQTVPVAEVVQGAEQHVPTYAAPQVPTSKAKWRVGRAVVAAVAAGMVVVGGAAGFALGYGAADHGPGMSASHQERGDDQGQRQDKRPEANGDTPPGAADGGENRRRPQGDRQGDASGG